MAGSQRLYMSLCMAVKQFDTLEPWFAGSTKAIGGPNGFAGCGRSLFTFVASESTIFLKGSELPANWR